MPGMGETTLPGLMRPPRSQHRGLSHSCKLHFERRPLKITKGSKQYVYDENGYEYLDCINNAAHVGHCHPNVVHAGQKQLAQLTHCHGFQTNMQSAYAQRLIDTLPESLNTCILVNSGSEANDLALRMARAYTRKNDVIVTDSAYHGSTAATIMMSPLKRGLASGCNRCEWVHVVSCPDVYRGIYQDLSTAGEKYAGEVKQVIQNLHKEGRQACAFISEAILTVSGMIVPPKDYFDHVYRCVKSAGALFIINEVVTGLGRCGEHYWAFQHFDIIPDIVTVGSPLANGQPLAAVITRREIADCFGEYLNKFGGNPMSCSMGLAVLDVIQNEKLLTSCHRVGRQLLQGLREMQQRHRHVGDVRGLGLCLGIDVVEDKESRKPSKRIAEEIMYSLLERRILVSLGGVKENVLLLKPPLCFNMENVNDFITAFDAVLNMVDAGGNVEDGTNAPQLYLGLQTEGPSSSATSEGGRVAFTAVGRTTQRRPFETQPVNPEASLLSALTSSATDEGFNLVSKKSKFDDMD